MPASAAAFTCGTSARGSGPANKSIRLAFWLTAVFMPWTYSVLPPWFCQTVKPRPTFAAAACIAFSILAVKGLALDCGIEKIVLPLAQALASKAGPGGMNSGLWL